MKYVSLIESFLPSFSKKEIKLAKYIIKEKEAICFMSLQEITKKISVSEATIVRFVKKIGFKGFVEFKLEVAREFSQVIEMVSEDYIENIENNIVASINSTKLLINKKVIEKAIEYIDKSKNMYIFGLGASGVAATEMQNRFMRFGKIGHNVNDGHFQVMYSSIMDKDDIIVVISLSGETLDLLYPLSIAKEKGVKIITITNYIKSSIARISDLVILTSSKTTLIDGGSLISKISQLYVVDILATGYALKNEKKSNAIKQTIVEAITNKNKD